MCVVCVYMYREPPSAEEKEEEEKDVFQQLCRNDLFSLGCIITELFLETPLFTQRTMQHYIEHNQLPSDVYKVK